MNKGLIKWNLYEISTSSSSIKGVMLRGRIRKFCLLNNKNIFVENASDDENKVRFAVIDNTDVSDINEKIKEMIPDAKIELIRKHICNPVLSKLKVNLEERYKL